MDQRQNNRLNMYEAVQQYLDNHIDKWKGLPVLMTFKNELDEQLSQIREHQDNQEAAKVFLGENKITQKRIVAEKADILNDALQAYAAVTNNAELQQKAARSFSELNRSRNQDFITILIETITLLEKHVKCLMDYGITMEQITDLKNSFDQFLMINGQPRQYRIAQKQATLGLSELFEQTTALLNNKVDKVLKCFKTTNPVFYSGYKAARVIVGR